MAGIIAFIIGIASASIFCDAASLVIIALSFLVCFFSVIISINYYFLFLNFSQLTVEKNKFLSVFLVSLL